MYVGPIFEAPKKIQSDRRSIDKGKTEEAKIERFLCVWTLGTSERFKKAIR